MFTVESRFRDSSQRLIQRFGKTRVYVSSSKTYDPRTQTVVTTEVLHTIKMFKTEPKEREIKSPNLVDKTVVVMMIAAKDLPIKPKVNDMIKDQFLGVEEVYQVVQVSVNEAGEDAASWRLVCTKS